MEIKCKICKDLEFNSFNELRFHLKSHKIKSYEYYYKYLYKDSKCPNCGKNVEWQGTIPGSLNKFCNKSCEMKYENKRRLAEGSHNFSNENGGKELRDRIRNKLISEGRHPFQPGNMSDEALARKHEGIRLARIAEAESGNHPWQSAKSRINNEKSRLLNNLKDKLMDTYQIYFADTEFEGYFKFGISYNINIREYDSRTYKIHNLICIREMKASDAIELEYELKFKYLEHTNYLLTNSYEMLPIEFKDEVKSFIENYPVK